MTKIQKHIEIVYSTISNLTSMGLESASSILSVLKREYETVGITTVNTSADLVKIVLKRPDLVFLGMKYVPSLSGKHLWVSEFLESHGIPHTGSAHRAIAYELNKPLAKQRVSQETIPTAQSIVIKKQQVFKDEDVKLTFPLFVKPADLGGGTGIDENSYTRNMHELRNKVTSITQDYATDALIEEYLPGREFSVAILKKEYSDGFYIMPLELVAPLDKHGARILTKEVKSLDTESSMEIIDKDIRRKISKLAADVFSALGARDYGRVDIRMDKHGTPYFLEANLLPSLRKNFGNFPKACLLNNGMDYETTIQHIARLGLARTYNQAPQDQPVDTIKASIPPVALLPIQ